MYRLVTSLQLGITGITDLRAQLLDPAGANSGSAISTGFTADLGGGQYLWDYSSYPDGFYGAVAFYRASAPSTRWIHAINPTETEIKGQMIEALITDTYAELASVPSATSSLKDKLTWLFMLARNKMLQTSAVGTLRNDADSGDVATSTVSDDGLTFTRGEWS